MKKILCVEDSKDIQMAISTILKIKGYDVVTVSDATEARVIIKNESFDLALLDINLPGKNGIEFLREERSKNKPLDIPVIIISGCSECGLTEEMSDLGVRHYFEKPFGPQALIDVIKDTIG